MQVFVGSDHAGFEFKAALVPRLRALGYDVTDVGPAAYDPDDDYPAYCLATAAYVVARPGSLGVVVGGSGNGEQIAANKVPGVRAALAWNADTAVLARRHNDANVVSIGARMHPPAQALTLVESFLAEPFSGDPRHARRIGQLADYERTGELPRLP